MKDRIRKIIVVFITTLMTLLNVTPTIIHAKDLDNADRQSIITEAEKHLGKPYIWGAVGPDSFDCSGYTQYVFKHSIGFNLQRTAEQQRQQLINEGKSISKTDTSKWQPGDLIFFGNYGEAEHVAIYYGDGKVIHALGDKVQINNFDYLIDKNGQKYEIMTVIKTVEDAGGFRVFKQDENGNPLAGATFQITTPNGGSIKRTTGSNGILEFSNLQTGSYTIKEVTNPQGYLINDQPRTIQVKAGDLPEEHVYSFVNKKPTGEITLTKYNEDKSATVPETSYDVTGPSGYCKQVKTNSEGKFTLKNLELGTYKIVERESAEGYLINPTPIVVTLTYKDNKTEIIRKSVEQTNKEPVANVTIAKKDAEQGTAQGDATLSGAVYELTAKEDIYNKAKTKKFYSKGEVVAQRTTDINGKMEDIKGIPLGKYQLKEIKPSNGYLLDKNVYDIDCAYEGQTVNVVLRTQTSNEQVKKQPFEIIKVSVDGSTEAELLEDIEFTVKLKSNVEKNGWDKAKTYDTLMTDKKGYAKSKELPFGTYIVKETRSKDNYLPIADFEVKVTEDSRTPQTYRVLNNEKFRALVKAVKKDKETGKVVALPGTTFKIKNLDTDEYVGKWVWFPVPHYMTEFETDESGTVTTPDVLECGKYQLEEIEAPKGYTVDKTPIQFTISTNTAYEMAEDGKTPVIAAYKNNVSVKGKINVTKIGERLVNVKKDKDGNHQFIYEDGPVDGARFTVSADEDILSADNQGTIIYHKGDKVAELVTKNGKAETSYLPLGKYSVAESVAGDNYIINSEVKHIELAYENQEVPVVFSNVKYKNERQKVDLSVIKKDKDNGQLLKGAEFGLYATSDIKAYDGKVLVKKGALIEKTTSNENGKASFKADLPLMKYEIKETKAPIGYTSTDKVVTVDASYQGQNKKVIELAATFENKITEIEVSKQDITTEKELPGAQLVIKEKDGTVFESWVSSNEPHIIKGLEPGKTYQLIETSSPYGFAIANTIEFVVKDSGELQKVSMKDDLVVGRLEWLKTGEVFTHTDTGQTEFGKLETPVFEKENITDAEITIYAAEDVTLGNGITYWHKDEEIQTLKSSKDKAISKDLLVGKYYYVESKTVEPFYQNKEKHYFEINDNQSSEPQIIESELKNERAKVNIQMKKVLEEHPYYYEDYLEAYKDVVFAIYAREDVKNYAGTVGIEKDTMIANCGIDENGALTNVPDLPIGKYYLKELSTNENFVLDANEYDFEIAYGGADVQENNIAINDGKEIVNTLKKTDVIISKIDKITKEPLSDVEFTLYDKNMSKLMVAVSDKAGIAIFENMPNGVYYCKETKARNGYALSDEVVKIVLDGNSKDHEYHVTMTNVLLPSKGVTVQTGDTTRVGMLCSIMVVSGVCVLATRRLKNRKNGKK